MSDDPEAIEIECPTCGCLCLEFQEDGESVYEAIDTNEETARLRTRVTELEGHRKQWRRIASRALDSLRSLDPKLATHLESEMCPPHPSPKEEP